MMSPVEWLINEIPVIDWQDPYWKIKLDKAKKMEKEQRQEDTNYGYSQGWDDGNQNKEPMRPELKQQEQWNKQQ
jgi:hypothetical protein